MQVVPDTPMGWLVAAAAGGVVAFLLSDGAAPASAATAGTAADDSEPICRICYAGAEAGRLFSPCLCTGTMGHVHVRCLSEWRTQSANPRSFYTCDQCGYAYRTQRTTVAEALQSERFVWAMASLLFVSLVLVGALLAAALRGTFQPERWLYDAIDWEPRREVAWWGPQCDHLIAGAMLPGAFGLALSAWQQYQRANGLVEMLLMAQVRSPAAAARPVATAESGRATARRRAARDARARRPCASWCFHSLVLPFARSFWSTVTCRRLSYS